MIILGMFKTWGNRPAALAGISIIILDNKLPCTLIIFAMVPKTRYNLMIILRMFKNLRQPPRGSCGDLCGQTKVAHDRCQLPWTPEERVNMFTVTMIFIFLITLIMILMIKVIRLSSQLKTREVLCNKSGVLLPLWLSFNKCWYCWW